MPLEKTFLPRFSDMAQYFPAAFTLRVKAASPGSKSSQSVGASWTVQFANLMVLGLGPGDPAN